MHLAASMLALFASSALVEAQLQLASVTAVVVDDRGPVSNATIALADPLGAELVVVITDASGRATFGAVSAGRYLLKTRAAGFEPFELPLAVADALPIEVTIRIPSAITDAVTVYGAPLDDGAVRRSLVAESVGRVPVRARGRAMQDAITTLAGWTSEDNGLLHVRGIDDGFLYVIDGVPVYERLDALSGIAPDVGGVSALNIITGYVPPEFGHKAGGVIEVRSGPTHPDWSGLAEIGFGGDAARDGSIVTGGRIGSRVRLTAGVAAARSERFLDPIHPENLHNTGGQASTFGQVGWESASTNRVTVGWGFGRSHFDVPNTIEQDEAGQNQRQRLSQGFLNATWQRVLSSHGVVQLAGYHRQSRARLDPSEFDTPIVALADRTLTRSGGLFAFTRQHASHLFKAGVEFQRLSLDEHFRLASTDEEEASFPDFVFSGRATPTLWSIYVQDSWQAASRLSISGGLRFDRTSLLLERSQVSPRVAAAFRIATDAVARASLSRFYQPPQPENLLLSSSPEAWMLSSAELGDAGGGAELEPERQWAAEVGFERVFRQRLRLDVAYWNRRIRNVADPNVFAGTTIIFPNAVAEGRAHGVDARFELPQHQGWTAYVNASIGRVIQTGPITGGLFLEDEVAEIGPGVEFTPDHDQRFATGAGVSWEHAGSGTVLSFTARHETGTPIQQEDDDLAELMERPGAEMVDFAEGRVKPRTVVSVLASAPLFEAGKATAVAIVQALNLFDDRYAFNFGNPFSGTHFGAPRTLAFALRVNFGGARSTP
jgi:outer membrane cobalamin receptor